MIVIKRDGSKEEFNRAKIKNAIIGAFQSVSDLDEEKIKSVATDLSESISVRDGFTVEEIQNRVELALMQNGYYREAKCYILYRQQHAEARFIKERIDYMNEYSRSSDNAATASETDANANVTMKNVANLEGEVYKTTNRVIQRQRMKDKLNQMFPEVAKQYEQDLNHHIIYTHDEASTPVLKQYCMAVSLYPLMTEGVGNIDGVTPGPPNDLQSFSGQITNLTFLLSSQCKGAVAFGEYFVVLNYYIISEFGPQWYDHLDDVATTECCLQKRTVRDHILKAFKQFIWGINQPAGNRSYQSPFTNVSYYDHTYFDSLFADFCYPDGTRPEWKAVDTLQRMFMKWFNQLRLKQVLTFPVETMAMVYDPETKDIIDKDYKEFTAEMYAEGHSFFTYISDSADSLASCCRLKNELTENTFNPTSGLTGVMTGSCNVITLNINRIVQDAKRTVQGTEGDHDFYAFLRLYLTNILERVYKYHIAYKSMLYEMEDRKMFAASNGGYIYISKLYSTIGINGLNEAARFLGLEVDNNPEYIKFLQLILGTIKEENKRHSIQRSGACRGTGRKELPLGQGRRLLGARGREPLQLLFLRRPRRHPRAGQVHPARTPDLSVYRWRIGPPLQPAGPSLEGAVSQAHRLCHRERHVVLHLQHPQLEVRELRAHHQEAHRDMSLLRLQQYHPVHPHHRLPASHPRFRT